MRKIPRVMVFGSFTLLVLLFGCQNVLQFLNIPVTGVTVTPTTESIGVGETTRLSALVKPANATNKTVVWTTDDRGIATVSSTGIVRGVAGGKATITATTADGGKRAASVVTVSNSVVAVQGITLNQNSTTVGVGGTFRLLATLSPTNATNKGVTWSSSNTGFATVSTDGLVTGVAAGSALITVTTDDGAYSASCGVAVSQSSVAVQSVSLNRTSATINVGGTLRLSAVIAPSGATDQNVTWSSNGSSVASVGPDGLVTAKAVGAATITATSADGAKDATCRVTVVAMPVAVTGVTLNRSAAAIEVGATTQLAATIQPADATNQNVTWSSSDPRIAAVDSSGLVTGMAGGTAMITVRTADGDDTASCTVTVSQAAQTPTPVTGVTLGESTATIATGDTLQLTETVAPSNATNKSVTWSSSNTTVATVSYTGVVTGETVGTAVITVTTVDGGKSATCTVNVQASSVPVTGVAASLHSASIDVTKTVQLSATVSPGNATNKTVVWSTSNKNVASVSSTGLVTGISGGSAEIKVSTVDGGFSDTCTVTVNSVKYNLTLSATTGGATKPAGTVSVVAGAAISIGAVPNAGYTFGGWSVVKGSGVIFGNRASPDTSVYLTAGDAVIQANFEPIGAFAYVTFAGSNLVWSFAVGATSGSLQNTPGTPYAHTGQAPTSVIEVLAHGKLPVVYAANSGSNDISAFTINTVTGELTEVKGSPFPLKGTAPMAIAADPDGLYLYAANAGSNNIDALSIDPSTGALSLLGEYAAQGKPWAITAHPNGYLYVTNRGSNDISAFTIDASSGKLTEIKGSPFAAGKLPTEAVIDPKGAFLYVANSGDPSILTCQIDTTTGALAAGKSLAAGYLPVSITTDSSGAFVYAADYYSGLGANVLGFISKSGVLSPIDGSPFKNVAGAYCVRTGPSGRFLFVADRDTNALSVYAINSSSGVLTMTANSPYKMSPSGPDSIAIVARQ